MTYHDAPYPVILDAAQPLAFIEKRRGNAMTMFVTPVYIAVLKSPHHADVLSCWETAAQAIAQAYAWTVGTDLVETTPPGLTFQAQYGKDEAATVTVQRCTLELADPADEEDALTLDLDAAAFDQSRLVTRVELLQRQQGREEN